MNIEQREHICSEIVKSEAKKRGHRVVIQTYWCEDECRMRMRIGTYLGHRAVRLEAIAFGVLAASIVHMLVVGALHYFEWSKISYWPAIACGYGACIAYHFALVARKKVDTRAQWDTHLEAVLGEHGYHYTHTEDGGVSITWS